jgi:hypothetical protein
MVRNRKFCILIFFRTDYKYEFVLRNVIVGAS